jgi:hypothetical protein
VIGFLTVLYSTAYLSTANRAHATPEDDQPRYYFWLLAFLASMTGVALAPNYLQLFIFWEITTVCSYALISFYRDRDSLRAGFKALVMTGAGGMFFLAALLILFVHTGSFDFDAAAELPASLRGWFRALMVAPGRTAQVPFPWLPDAMAAPRSVPTRAAAWGGGVFLMARRSLPAGGPPTVARRSGDGLLTIFVVVLLLRAGRPSGCWPTRRSPTSATCCWVSRSAGSDHSPPCAGVSSTSCATASARRRSSCAPAPWPTPPARAASRRSAAWRGACR